MPRLAATHRSRTDADAKNAPLVEDIRLLGRILGQVIREQEGDEAYQLIERIRRLSVAFRLKRDHHAGRELTKLLKGLSTDQTVSVIRAFSYFSHLANIAEDRHHVRRRQHHEQAGRALDRLLKNLSGDQTVSVIRAFSYFSHLANIAEDRHRVRRRDHHERQGHLQEGSLAMSLERLADAGIRADEIARTLAHAYISPARMPASTVAATCGKSSPTPPSGMYSTGKRGAPTRP